METFLVYYFAGVIISAYFNILTLYSRIPMGKNPQHLKCYLMIPIGSWVMVTMQMAMYILSFALFLKEKRKMTEILGERGIFY